MLSRTLASTLVLLAAAVSQAQVPETFHPQLACLRSPHAEGNISEAHALQALWYAAAELKVPAEKVPRIILVHGGRDIAMVAGVPLWNWRSEHGTSGALLVEPTSSGEKLYYLWVIGKPSDDVLARGFVQILQSEFSLADTDLVASAKRVQLRLGSTVRANDLQKGMFAARQ